MPIEINDVKINALQSQVTELESQLTVKTLEAETLKQNKGSSAITFKSFENKGKNFIFLTNGFIVEGTIRSQDDILGNPEWIELAAQSGCVKQID